MVQGKKEEDRLEQDKLVVNTSLVGDNKEGEDMP